MVLQVEDAHHTLPNQLPVESLFDGLGFNKMCLSTMLIFDGVFKLINLCLGHTGHVFTAMLAKVFWRSLNSVTVQTFASATCLVST